MLPMNRNYFAPTLFVGLFLGIFIGFFGFKYYSKIQAKSNLRNTKIEKLLKLIEKEYVDNVNTDSIIDLTVNNILSQLDPHSTYISKSEIEDTQNLMKGSFVGIGINYYMLNDTLAIVKPLEGGPSAKAGLKAGDRILQVNGNSIADGSFSNDSIVALLKGQRNSSVSMKIFRKKNKETFDVHLKRDEVPIKSVDAGLKINDSLGYIKINRFSETTYTEFEQSLKALTKEQINSLVLDLRDNTGGYVEPAVKIANQFLDKNDTIVKTINKQGNAKITIASSKGLFTQGKLYILINENTASASEIIAGAIQDNDRGTIIGRRSYGKGLVQREMTLGDGSAVRLTVARYFTPSGRSIQKPYKEYNNKYSAELSQRFVHGELYDTDKRYIDDSLKFKTKKGKIVYGGGGIVPDIYVESFTKHGEDAIQLLMKTSLVSYYVFEQIEKERAYLEKKKYLEIAELIYKNSKYFNELKVYLKESGLTFNLDKHKDRILFYLAAEYINQLFSDKEYYSWMLTQDQMIDKVVKR